MEEHSRSQRRQFVNEKRAYSKKIAQVPLPFFLHIVLLHESMPAMANAVHISAWIKVNFQDLSKSCNFDPSVCQLVTLSWGIVKFTKLRFFWCCLPLNPKHDFR